MMNNVEFNNVMVFKHVFNERESFSVGIRSKQYVNGHLTDDTITAYINLQFPRDDKPNDREKIDIKKSFLASYPDKNGNPQLKIVVQEWESCDDDSFGV